MTMRRYQGANEETRSRRECRNDSYSGLRGTANIAEVTDIGYARRGAQIDSLIPGFVSMRRASAYDAHITVASHSYGSTTAGTAHKGRSGCRR